MNQMTLGRLIVMATLTAGCAVEPSNEEDVPGDVAADAIEEAAAPNVSPMGRATTTTASATAASSSACVATGFCWANYGVQVQKCVWSGTSLTNFAACWGRGPTGCWTSYLMNGTKAVYQSQQDAAGVYGGYYGPPPSLAERIAGQKAAQAELRYFFGDTTAIASTDPKRPAWDRLRAAYIKGTVTVDPPVPGPVTCGLATVTYHFAEPNYNPGSTYSNDIMAVTGLGTSPAATSITRASIPFRSVEYTAPNGYRSTDDNIDPEPAQTTAPLSGSAGASAAAVFVNSGEATTVRKWPATFVAGGATPPVAGTPCSTTDLAAGQQATHFIFKSGTLYKCL